MLYEKTNYSADISYLTNTFIREYDISKCNINILYTYNCIDLDTYRYLYDSKRMVRQVYVGKLIKRDPEIGKILKSGITEARRMFIEANGIQDHEILSIKNDAIYLISKVPMVTKFGLIEFREKRTYTSFFKLNNLELYYYYNNYSKEEYIDVKGISDENIKEHEGYFLQFIQDILYFIQTQDCVEVLEIIKSFYRDYINRNLSIGFYRQFNANSKYHLMYTSEIGTGYDMYHVREEHKHLLDISYNLSLILQLNKYVTNMYFNNHKRNNRRV